MSRYIIGRRETTPTGEILTLFRGWKSLYEQAGDMALKEVIASSLLDQCKEIEKRMMTLPASSAADFAAKLIVSTSYGDFILDGLGEGGLLDEAVSLVDGGAS